MSGDKIMSDAEMLSSANTISAVKSSHGGKLPSAIDTFYRSCLMWK